MTRLLSRTAAQRLLAPQLVRPLSTKRAAVRAAANEVGRTSCSSHADDHAPVECHPNSNPKQAKGAEAPKLGARAALMEKLKNRLEDATGLDLDGDGHVGKPSQSFGMTMRHSGGIPDFIHMWGPGPFYRVGYGLIAASLGSVALSVVHEFDHILPLVVGGVTAGYWYIGLRDLQQKEHALRSNFPVLIHTRYILESIRPEIQQYFIEPDDAAVIPSLQPTLPAAPPSPPHLPRTSPSPAPPPPPHLQVPYSREMRSIVYQRSSDRPPLEPGPRTSSDRPPLEPGPRTSSDRPPLEPGPRTSAGRLTPSSPRAPVQRGCPILARSAPSATSTARGACVLVVRYTCQMHCTCADALHTLAPARMARIHQTCHGACIRRHEWAAQSLFPVHIDPAGPASRVRVGGPECAVPYDASLLNISVRRAQPSVALLVCVVAYVAHHGDVVAHVCVPGCRCTCPRR